MTLYLIVGLVVGLALGFGLDRWFASVAGKSAAQRAQTVTEEAKREAESLLKEARIAAKDEMLKAREEFDARTQARKQELQGIEQELKTREVSLEQKVDQLQRRLDEVSRRDHELNETGRQLQARQQQVEALVHEQETRLATIAGLTREQARAELLGHLETELANERGALLRKHVEELKQRCLRESQKLMIEAMQRYAGEVAYDRTTCTVPLPSDEMKGRIIGREGRNIRVFEAITGVNVLIDDTPSAVVISCFEPVRREIARLSLERLVADGRIHPSRVEEVVAKAKKDIEVETVKAGEDAVHMLGLNGVATQVVQTLGRLRFRYSYSQNVLQHSLEVARLMGMVATELHLDVAKAKRMGLFHDIGKAMDHEVEGSHAIIGMEFLKRAGEDREVLNGVGCHHDEIPAESPLAALVSVCDALSASRPGARSETTEIYLKRLDQLEVIGTSFAGVEQCYAVQAGREIRIVVEPQKVTENEALDMSRKIAQRIEQEVQYPGQIKVCVIRETRSVEYAR